MVKNPIWTAAANKRYVHFYKVQKGNWIDYRLLRNEKANIWRYEDIYNFVGSDYSQITI